MMISRRSFDLGGALTPEKTLMRQRTLIPGGEL
jgi:hypothetical protein